MNSSCNSKVTIANHSYKSREISVYMLNHGMVTVLFLWIIR